MPGTLTRPNANPILDMMRDGDTHDMFGLAMSYLFGIAECLYDADPNDVPGEWGYRPALAGTELPTSIHGRDVPYESVGVWEYLHNVTLTDPDATVDPESLAYWDDDTFAGRIADLQFAGRCLHRLVAWLDAAGKSY